MSRNARMTRISSLGNMLSISSNSLVSMASQLSEAKERERSFNNRGRWNLLRSMGDAKILLQYMVNSLSDARCQIWGTGIEANEMKEQLKGLVGLLRQSELRRIEVEKQLKLRRQEAAIALATASSQEYEKILLLQAQADLAEDHAPMEIVEKPENAITKENQQGDEPQANRLTWKIENMSRLNTIKHYSKIFRAGGCNWLLVGMVSRPLLL